MTYPGQPGGRQPGGGGIPPRRRDQPYSPPPAGLVPGSRSGIFRGHLVIVGGPGAGIFLYNGAPAAGNPPVFWAVSPGTTTDPFGNTVAAVVGAGTLGGPGLAIDQLGDLMTTAIDGSQVSLIPSLGLPVSLTSSLSGTVLGALTLVSSDLNETQAGIVADIVLGTGTARKIGTLITSPYVTTGMGVLLQAANDGGTDTASALIGTVTTQGGAIAFTPAVAIFPTATIVYGGGGTVNVVTRTSGTGTIPIPANAAATGVGEAWGFGGQGGTTGGFANFGAGGGGAGGYSQEPALAITAGGTAAFTIPGARGADVTLTGTAVTVTAHPGVDGHDGSTGAPGAGAAASGNTVARPGLAGGQGAANGGGGGGAGSPGPGGPGHAGGPGAPHAGGNGGDGAAGGANGGNGGGPNNNGAPAGNPGAGGGGGGVNQHSGGNFGGPMVRLTFNAGTFSVLSSSAAATFTDQFGNTILAGQHIKWPDGVVYQVGENVLFTTAAQTIAPTGVTDIINSQGPGAVLGQPVIAGTYFFWGIFRIKQGAAAANPNQNMGFTGPATSACVWYYSNGGQGSTMTSQKVVVGSLSLVAQAFPAINDEQYIEFMGTVTFTAAGTFKCQAQAPTAGDNFTIQPGCIFAVRPLQ